MDLSSFLTLFQTIIVLILIIFLANVSLKYLSKYMHKQNKIIKVVERTSVFNNSAIGIVDICGIYYLMSFTDKDNKILKELEKSEVESILEQMDKGKSSIDVLSKKTLHFGMRKKSE